MKRDAKTPTVVRSDSFTNRDSELAWQAGLVLFMRLGIDVLAPDTCTNVVLRTRSALRPVKMTPITNKGFINCLLRRWVAKCAGLMILFADSCSLIEECGVIY